MIGSIATAVAAAAKTAEAIAERAERQQLIDAGEAQKLAESLKATHAQLQEFNAAADRVDTDGEFARRVRDKYTLSDD